MRHRSCASSPMHLTLPCLCIKAYVSHMHTLSSQRVRAPDDHAHGENIPLAQEDCRQHHDANHLRDRQIISCVCLSDRVPAFNPNLSLATCLCYCSNTLAH